MKRIIVTCILFFVVFTSVEQTISSHLSTPTNLVNFYFEREFSRIRIDYNYNEKNFITTQGKYGEPEIVVVQKKFVVPMNADDIEISITSYSENTLEGNYLLYPEQPPRPVNFGDYLQWVDPITEIYNSDESYPGKTIELANVESAFGYKIITVNIYPITYKPDSLEITCLESISFNINYSFNNLNLVLPERISEFRSNMNASVIRSIVSNPDDVENFLGGALQVVDNSLMSDFIIPTFPISTGIVPDEIIITSSEFVASFETLASWRTRCGFPTVIISTDDISKQYPAPDLAASIFFYLKDVYNRYGPLYIILGGDIEIVPARYAYYDGHEKIWRPTDLYYADVHKPNFPNYNWNFNGNAQYGETGITGDQLDLGPEHYVGRFPVSSVDEIDVLTSKIFSYEHSNQLNQNYYDNLLYIASYLDYDEISQTYLSYSGDLLNTNCINPLLASNSSLEIWRLYDDPSLANINTTYDEILNKVNAIDNLNFGGTLFESPFHLIYHIDHSSAYSLGTSTKVAHNALYRTDVNNLINGTNYNIFFTGGCSPNSFDYSDAISEEFILNPNGGCVAFIGSTATSYQLDYNFYGLFCFSLFNDNNSIIANALRTAATNASYRTRTALLGDPLMDIWTSTPSILSSTNQNTIYTGEQTISISLNNLDLNASAIVCLYKEEEVYERLMVIGTGDPLVLEIECSPNTPGDLYLTVTSHNYKPLEKIINVVNNPNAHLYVSSFTIDDDIIAPSFGNSDGNVDAGEIVEIVASITNQGLTDAQNVLAGVTSNTSYLTVNQQTASFGQIGSLSTVTGSQAFEISVSPDSPDHSIASLSTTIQSGSNFNDYIDFEIHAPTPIINLSIVSTSINNDKVIDPGDHVYLNFDIYNSGSGKTTGLSSTITCDPTYITNVSNSNSTFSMIMPYSNQINSTPFEFDVVQTYNNETIELTLTLTSTLGQEWIYSLNLDAPQTISGLDYSSTINTISVYWNSVLGISGYNIYRSNTVNGNYSKINDAIIQGYSGFTDIGLEELSIYYYKVSAVSLSGIEGPLSSELKAWTTLPYHTDWPEVLIKPDVIGGRSEGSAAISDINIDNDKEVFLVLSDGNDCSHGTLMGFYHDREELFDIDNNPTEVSGFHPYQSGIQCTPAIGDVNNDNIEEIITVTVGSNSLYDRQKIFVNSVLDSDNDGKPDLLWSNPIGGPNIRGVVLSDIDNNGSLEIIEKGNWGSAINVLNGDGSNYSGAWPLSIGCQSGNGMPVACDIDNDGDNELIFGFETATYENSHTDAGIYIYNIDGSSYLVNNLDGLFYKHINNSEYDQMDCTPVIANLVGDEYKEMVFVSGRLSDLTARVFITEALHSLGTNIHNQLCKTF